MRLVLASVALLLLAGCAELVGIDGASQWEWSKEASMYPDFTGHGEGYPVLLLHSHTTQSEKQKEYYRQNPVVCLMADQELPLPTVTGGRDVDAAPCPPRVYDPAAGRLFVAREDFESWDADALVIRKGCGGSISVLDEATPGFRVSTPEHDFHVRWDDGVFYVDGEILRPGEALRITYWIDYGDPRNQRMVRVVLDYPGQWLEEMVGFPHGEPGMPVEPTRADGLQVTVPADLGAVHQVIAAVAEAMPVDATLLGALRIVHGPDGLRDIHVMLGDGTTAVTWYLASRSEAGLRLLGNVTATSAGIEVAAFTAAFPGFLDDYGDVDGAVSVVTQWSPQWTVATSALHGVETPCQDCLYAWGEGPLGTGWQGDPLAARKEATDALSLHVTAVDADGKVRTALYAR